MYHRYEKHGQTATRNHRLNREWSSFWVGLMAVVLALSTVSISRGQGAAREAEQTLQAQRILSTLGYDAGTADGIVGPRTQQAIEAFQRAYNLAPTGELDPPTLIALGVQQPNDIPTRPLRAVPTTPQAPWRVVLMYLRYYDTNPARLLPYVTEQFRQGRPPREWLADTKAQLDEQQFYRLSWHIEQVETETTPAPERHATVHVQSRIRMRGEETVRRETFFLIQRDESVWLINDWQSHRVSTAESTTDVTPAGR